MSTADPPHRNLLRALVAEAEATRQQVADLVQYDEDGTPRLMTLSTSWQPLAGREGVRIFHVPDPSGEPGLFLTIYCAEPGAHYAGSRLDTSRRVAVLSGDLSCNGRHHRAGGVFFLSPGESTTWQTETGSVGATLYGAHLPESNLEQTS